MTPHAASASTKPKTVLMRPVWWLGFAVARDHRELPSFRHVPSPRLCERFAVREGFCSTVAASRHLEFNSHVYGICTMRACRWHLALRARMLCLIVLASGAPAAGAIAGTAPLAYATEQALPRDDIQIITEATRRVRDGDVAAATVLRNRIRSGLGRKLVEWTILRSGSDTVSFRALCRVHRGQPHLAKHRLAAPSRRSETLVRGYRLQYRAGVLFTSAAAQRARPAGAGARPLGARRSHGGDTTRARGLAPRPPVGASSKRRCCGPSDRD